ncbi:hypothetical protein [Mesorhizobium silamurunense]|uniref:hypothetical protein n=1 Tax=Mesorhizobium silamurunense TaxID=499528 RepID=UPI00177D1537|nr:hypothetical protein [Mesorhizobium silamurunense]
MQITKTFFDKTASPLPREAATLDRGASMKKVYEKPTLSKRGKLSGVVAVALSRT